MGTYQCEGFIKEIQITKEGVTFTLEPVAPYLFEKKSEDGKTKKLLLLVGDSKKPKVAKTNNAKINEAKILDGDENPKFSTSNGCCLSAILIAKANHLRVRIKLNLQLSTIQVETITVV